jgi:membrane protease subunit HflK
MNMANEIPNESENPTTDSSSTPSTPPGGVAAPKPAQRPRLDGRAAAQRVRSGVRSGWQAIRGDGESPLADVRAALGNIKPGRVVAGLLALAAIAYLATGIYVVAPGEAAVVRRFGAVAEPRVQPGLHYRLPWPVDRLDIVNVSQVRRETVGVATPEEDHEHPEPPGKLQALSGDTNVIDAEIIAQYQVSDPAAYVVNVGYAPYRLIRDVIRSAVTSLVTQQQVDNILTVDRQALQNTIRSEAQARLDAYNSGLVIVGINLQKVFPPDEVAQAFTDVNSAKEDRARAINEAQGYANSLLPQARGEAEKILSDGNAYRSNALADSKGAAQAFESVLEQYATNSKIYGRDVTRYRLYLEMLDKVLPNVHVYVVDTANGGVTNLRLYSNSQSANQTQQR